MALDTRNCFWFGTEERSSWFATPLQGADSSPSAWGADGTLLNGGGWGLHSWGSHKRYTYEWPASSSREVAQMMKSYRDGTYGRGLLYFLEPTIFSTNVLPAHWADPSMALDNEAPSLVYGIDPTPVPTSGGANLGLPVTSAHYDLSGTPYKSTPTLDSSVFIPIPTGHTLFLGAFYSATGDAGVYATPVNNNGTLGAAVKLTPKPNSDTDVVTDQFSGDLRGVRLWVGHRTSVIGQTPSITISAMAGRLIESSALPLYGPWVEVRRNLVPNPAMNADLTGWSTSTGGGAAVDLSRRTVNVPFAGIGGVARVELLTPGTWWRARTTTMPVTEGETYRATAWIYGTAGTVAIRIRYYDSSGETISEGGPGEAIPGSSWRELTYAAPAPAGAASARIEVSRSETDPGTFFYVTAAMFEEGEPVRDYFDGNSSPTTDISRYGWEGAVNGSVSYHETRSRTGSPAPLDKLSAGPWIGGQGHSGCRFLGTPTYVTNSPIEGGRIGFAASFVEVGSWVYG